MTKLSFRRNLFFLQNPNFYKSKTFFGDTNHPSVKISFCEKQRRSYKHTFDDTTKNVTKLKKKPQSVPILHQGLNLKCDKTMIGTKLKLLQNSNFE